jgi:membrane-associated phospholipid phosphatase
VSGGAGSERTGRPDSDPAPASGFLSVVATVDDRVDRLFEPLRGRGPADAAAKVITGLGDHGWLWTGIAVWRGRRSGPARRQAIRALGVAGVSSTLVNAGMKQLVDRDRPDRSDLRISNAGVPVRAPKTSSFPSGHTLAAFCSAAVLSRPGDRRGNALLYTAAGLIGVSRIHLGHHHASDVAGGIVIGTALGHVVRRFR